MISSQTILISQLKVLEMMSSPYYDDVIPEYCVDNHVHISALIHIRQIHYNFFTVQLFCSRPLFIVQFFATKNAVCVNGTIEITLEQIQHDIMMSKMPQIWVICVMTLRGLQTSTKWTSRL